MSIRASRILALPGRGVDVPVLLLRWRSRELWTARQFRACGGSSLAEVEDFYDETIAALVEKDDAYESEEHLRSALHRGIKMRAMRSHRDRQARARTLEQAAPAIESAGQEQAWRAQPERALIAREDDLIVGEFVAELTDLERRVFALVADGRSWRAIATALNLPETEARNATRACERKRARFLTLYSTGRLCGYRSQTIGALLAGAERSELAVGQALAHLRHCRECCAQHRTDAAGLRAAFDSRVLGVLPAPIFLSTHASLLDPLQAALSRIARFLQRAWAPQAGARERVVEVVAGTGAGAKLAAGVVGVALLAGTTIGVSRIVAHHPYGHHGHRSTLIQPTRTITHVASPRPQRTVRRHAALPGPHTQRVAGPFGYLGVPIAPKRRAPIVTQRGGGPFGP